MDICAVFEGYTREELYKMICSGNSENLRLKALLTTAGEELYRLGADCPDLMKAVEDSEREWLPSYSIGGYNQMRMYIHELEQLLGPEAAQLRQDRTKYLVDWFKATEPK